MNSNPRFFLSHAITTLTLLLSLTAWRPADAGLIVSVEDVSLLPGVLGVSLRSTGADTAVRVSALNFRLRLGNNNNPGSLLQFTTVLDTELVANPDYIFGGLPSFPATLLIPANPQLVDFSDFIDDNTNSLGVDVSMGKLIGLFSVTGDPSAPPFDGDQFDVTVEDLAIFLDPDFTQFTGAVEIINGTVTVAAAVPEPSSLTGIAAFGIVAAWHRRRRCRHLA